MKNPLDKSSFFKLINNIYGVGAFMTDMAENLCMYVYLNIYGVGAFMLNIAENLFMHVHIFNYLLGGCFHDRYCRKPIFAYLKRENVFCYQKKH